MGGLFFPMAGLGKLGEVLLYVGLALALLATALYIRDGRRELQQTLKLSLTVLVYTARSAARRVPAGAPRPSRDRGDSQRWTRRFPTSAR